MFVSFIYLFFISEYFGLKEKYEECEKELQRANKVSKKLCDLLGKRKKNWQNIFRLFYVYYLSW